MAKIDILPEDGTTAGNPATGNYFIFLDSSNSDLLTVRNSVGSDTVLDLSTLSNRVIVQDSSDFGVIDSTKEYFIDGIIDMTGVTITVPAGGINIKGYDFNTSGLVCADSFYTMFDGATAGNVNIQNVYIEVSASASKIFDLTSNTGFEALEMINVNFINCNSIGQISDFRQYFESNTGRFGGTPNIDFSGTMNGIFVRTSIVRNLNPAFTGALFEEGNSLSITGRFLTDANIDLPASAAFCDFQSANFVNPSSFQIDRGLFSRNGVIDTMDANIVPNISNTDLKAFFKNNKGIKNTFEGAKLDLTTEAATVILGTGTFEDLNGTFTASGLTHFTAGAGSILQHDGDNPIEYKVSGYFVIEGLAGNELTLRIAIDANNDDAYETSIDFTRTVSNSVRGDDVAIFVIIANIELPQNGKFKLQISNNSAASNVTAELGSYLQIDAR